MFDSDKLETRGAEVPVLNDIEPDSFGFGDVSISRDGTLVYRKAAGATAGSTIDWLDAAGKRQTLLAKPGAYANPRFSPDGKRLAMLVREGSGQNVWVYDLERGTNSRLTDSGTVTALAWSPDGRYVVLGGLGTSLMEVRSDGSSQPQPLFQNDKGFPTPRPGSFPPGGRLAFFDEILQQIWTAPVREQGGQLKAGQPEQFLQTTSQSPSPAVSPDGHWLAYQSESTGKSEIYVRAFPQPGVGDQVPISNDGGTQPVWTKHDLLYQSGDRIMAVSYTVNGNQFMPDKPRVWLAKLDGATGWDLAPGGQRVAVITPVGGSEAPKAGHEIVMWQNFFDYLRQRVPVK